jgi:hypothetical protein
MLMVKAGNFGVHLSTRKASKQVRFAIEAGILSIFNIEFDGKKKACTSCWRRVISLEKPLRIAGNQL